MPRSPIEWPDLTEYAALFQPPSGAADVTATFLGVSTFWFTDGTTNVMTDGFFSRPSLARVVAGRIGPDARVVRECLARAQVRSLDALVCAHSHYDHALDAPVVVQQAGGVLVGSESTANIGRGSDLPETRIVVIEGGDRVVFGDFEITAVESVHSPGDKFPGTIARPLVPSARAGAWRTGACFSLVIAHKDRRLLHQASANFVPGALSGVSADVVLLSIALLGRQSPQFRRQYWEEVVLTTGARRVIPIHWDDFFKPLSQPLRPMPRPFDDFRTSMHFLIEQSRRAGIDLRLPVAWQPADPFAGLD